MYTLEVANWIGRMAPSPAEAETVYKLFRRADAHVRQIFNIVYDGNTAVRFKMPVALVLAVKATKAA